MLRSTGAPFHVVVSRLRRCSATGSQFSERCGSGNMSTVSVFRPTAIARFTMRPGTLIPGLDIYKDKDAPVALDRSEYPDWLESLARPLPTLAALRRMPEEDATDRDKMRYLKLTRRVQIKKNNIEIAGKKR